MALANTSDDCTAKRGPYSPLYTATSPTVTVRGVECCSTCPIAKSSKKLPSLALLPLMVSVPLSTNDYRCHPRTCSEDPAFHERRSERLAGCSGQARA